MTNRSPSHAQEHQPQASNGQVCGSQNDLLRVDPQRDQSERQRLLVARLAAGVAIVFGILAVACMVLERSFVPLSWGSGVFVELALRIWPSAYALAALHNLCIATVAMMFVVASTSGQVPVPAHHQHPSVLICRRRSKFVGTEVVCIAVLGAGGWVLHGKGFELLAGLLECLASGVFIRALAIAFLPSARTYLVAAVVGPDGIAGGLRVGGIWRSEFLFHEQVLDFQVRSTIMGYCFGLASIGILRVDQRGRERFIWIHQFASIKACQQALETVSMLKRGRHPDALKSIWGKQQLSPWPGGQS